MAHLIGLNYRVILKRKIFSPGGILNLIGGSRIPCVPLIAGDVRQVGVALVLRGCVLAAQDSPPSCFPLVSVHPAPPSPRPSPAPRQPPRGLDGRLNRPLTAQCPPIGFGRLRSRRCDWLIAVGGVRC